jgi:AraC-like DNA-binding protein
MDRFQIIQPSALLAPYVKHYWFMTINSEKQAFERIIPTGMICLMFHRGERIFSLSKNQFQSHAFLSGLNTAYSDLSYQGKIDMISVEFRPAGAKAFFKIPMMELNERSINIDALNDAKLLDLEKRLSETADSKTCVFLIEQFLHKRIHQLEAYNLKRMNAVIHAIYSGQQNIETLAQTACLGYKQFKRIFTDYVGANPKDYLRVVRFQKSLHTLQTQPNINLAQLAYDCGYFDQAHFIKDFKQFSGYTPTEYITICTPHSDFFA